MNAKVKVCFVLSLLVLYFLMGCGLFEDKIFTSEDGKFSIVATSSWRINNELSDEASIQISSPIKEKYLMVLTNDISELLITFDSINSLSTGIIKESLTEPQFAELERTDTKIRSEISGIYEEHNITYLLTVLDTGHHYHQIISWTHTDEYDNYKNELIKIADSFAENTETSE